MAFQPGTGSVSYRFTWTGLIKKRSEKVPFRARFRAAEFILSAPQNGPWGEPWPPSQNVTKACLLYIPSELLIIIAVSSSSMFL
jgi:hypothetical protein